jgi:hypothetical protein
VTTWGGKSTSDPPNPNNKAGKAQGQWEEGSSSTKTQKDQEEEETAPQDFVDTSYLLFPTRNRKQTMDEQFARFVEMIEKIHMSVPLMDIFHVPSYTKYVKDIINNKRPLPSMEVIKLTEECSATILNHLPKRRRTLGALQSHAQLGPSSLIMSCAT